jgi:hypothetical protein
VPTEHIKYLLPDYVNGHLGAELLEGVESHLRACGQCREEMESLRDVFAYLAAHVPERPSASYYASILPRVHQRLEQKEAGSLLSHPLIVRLVAPLACAVLAIVLLLHVPFPGTESGRDVNPLQSVVSETSTEELAQAVLEHFRQQPLANNVSEGEISSLIAAHVLRPQVLVEEIDFHSAGSLEPLFSSSSTQAIEGLTESEVDALLQRLGERTIL